MYSKLIFSLILTSLFSCTTQTENNPRLFNAAQAQFKYSGRSEIRNDTTRALISSAAHVVFNAEGDSITLLMNSEGDLTSYMVVEVNGDQYERFRIFSDSVNRITIPLPLGKNSQIGVYKATEASNGPLLYYGVEAKNIVSVKDTTTATIEFIGDSITCGYGADTEDIPCDKGAWYDQHNAYLAYGPLAARKLNAEYWLSSVSGMGMYRNWNDEDAAPVMGEVYTTTHLDGNKEKQWNFSGKQPDLVSIFLGTNDLSNGDGIKERKPFDSEKFTANYINFVKGVFKRYPTTKLTMLTSPIVSSESNALLLDCLQKVKAQFENEHTIAIFEFSPMKPNGCGAHPDLGDHKIMANELEGFYADVLKK